MRCGGTRAIREPKWLHSDSGRLFDRYEPARVNFLMRLSGFSSALAVLIVCAGFSLGQSPASSETGIEGVITVNPARPGPARIDAPNSQPVANTAFVVESRTGEVTSFTTDQQGRFRVSLAPGHYKVSIKGRRAIGRFGPFETDVVAGQMTKVQWECDSGMR